MTAPAYDPRQPYGIGNGITVRDNLRLSAVIDGAMRYCRKDLGRMMSDFDYCSECPLLMSCVSQVKQEEDAHSDHDGENARRRAEVAAIRAETRARGGHEI